jgi:hypothetical protein
MIIEYLLIGLSLLVASFAAYRTLKNPSDLEKRVEGLRTSYDSKLDTLRSNYERQFNDMQTRLEQYRRENYRLQEIIVWLRIQLREHGIEIERLPEELQEPKVAGNISIRIGDKRTGGVDIGGNAKVETQGNIVGDDVKGG